MVVMTKFSVTLMQLKLMKTLRIKDQISSIPREPTVKTAHTHHLMTMEENLILTRHSLYINKLHRDLSNSINRSLNNQRTWVPI